MNRWNWNKKRKKKKKRKLSRWMKMSFRGNKEKRLRD